MKLNKVLYGLVIGIMIITGYTGCANTKDEEYNEDEIIDTVISLDYLHVCPECGLDIKTNGTFCDNPDYKHESTYGYLYNGTEDELVEVYIDKYGLQYAHRDCVDDLEKFNEASPPSDTFERIEPWDYYN